MHLGVAEVGGGKHIIEYIPVLLFKLINLFVVDVSLWFFCFCLIFYLFFVWVEAQYYYF